MIWHMSPNKNALALQPLPHFGGPFALTTTLSNVLITEQNTLVLSSSAAIGKGLQQTWARMERRGRRAST